jgi:hypothetical protein
MSASLPSSKMAMKQNYPHEYKCFIVDLILLTNWTKKVCDLSHISIQVLGLKLL